MASFETTAAGVRAQVSVSVLGKPKRESKTLPTMKLAKAWAAAREAELRGGAGRLASATLQEVFLRYASEVSPTKRGELWEVLRINAWLKAGDLPMTLPVSRVTVDHVSAWRDARGRKVSAGSVLREISLLSAVFEHARRDWRLILVNPVTDMRKPKQPEHRDRLISQSEQRIMLRALGVKLWQPPKSVTASIGYALLLALHTGLRSAEMTRLEWRYVSPKEIHIAKTKTDAPRDVPLSPSARRIIALMRGFDQTLVFGVDSRTRDTLWRRARDNTGLSGFTFHDSRHNAATRIGARVGKPDGLSFVYFCKMFGWKDPKYALRYCNPSASDLADLL
jgi:integrase